MSTLQRLVATHPAHGVGSGAQAPWLAAMREASLVSFERLDFPTTRLEEWKYTSTRRLSKLEWTHQVEAPQQAEVDRAQALLDAMPLADVEHLLVFLNGRFHAGLSRQGKLPEGCVFSPLAQVLGEGGQGLEQRLGRHLDHESQAFTALNTAFLQDGLFLSLPRGAVVEQPIHVAFVSLAGRGPVVCHPRSLVTLADNARAQLVEMSLGEDEEGVFTNSITEVELGPGAHLGHHLWHMGGAYRVGRVQATLKADSHLSSHSFWLGGDFSRQDVDLTFSAPGASCQVDGLYVLGESQHVDNHTSIHHIEPHCTSRELFKGVLGGQSRGVFNGKVVFHQDAQKSDAQQSNHNLLLSDTAHVDTKPQLEIFADDVRASHGTTVGQLDEQALFYLRSRGIDSETAGQILTGAFVSDVIDAVGHEGLRAKVDTLVRHRLAQILSSAGRDA